VLQHVTASAGEARGACRQRYACAAEAIAPLLQRIALVLARAALACDDVWSLRAVAVLSGLRLAVGIRAGGRQLTQAHPADPRPAQDG
jgi:hypothetical protein